MMWTSASIERLTRLVEEGCTALAISQILETSRNAVAGKVHRLGLKLNLGNGAKGRGVGKRGPNNGRSKIPQITVKVYRQRWEPLRDTAVEPLRVQFLDLNDSHCRYVLDERGDDLLPMFCGLPKHGDSSWCYGHCCEVFKPRMECVSGPTLDFSRGQTTPETKAGDELRLPPNSESFEPKLLGSAEEVHGPRPASQ